MSKITELSYVIEYSDDEETLWVAGTDKQVEILDFQNFLLPNGESLITFYVNEGNKYGGVTLSQEQLENWDKEHFRDAFILALN
jgi:hypothetical protein